MERVKISDVKGGEITTSAQREHCYEVLQKQAEEKGLAEDVTFYLEFFKYGCPPHGGFRLVSIAWQGCFSTYLLRMQCSCSIVRFV